MEQFTDIKSDDCMICCDEINNTNVVFYLINDQWNQYNVCKDCTINLLNKKWFDYIDMIKNADCEKALKNLLEINIPSKLTVTTTFYSQPIDRLYYDGNYQTSDLNILNINMNQLQEEFKSLYINIINDASYDYLSEIKRIELKYNL